ncbi:MAG: endonuclease domain-containing protein [Actinomycetota bacterium]
MAGVLYLGGGSTLSFRAAARAHDFRGFDNAPVEFSTVARLRAHDLDLKIHRCDRFLLGEIEQVGPLPVTSIPRTLMDLFGQGHFRAERALDQVLREERSTLGIMWLYHDQTWTRGRRGIAILRSHLQERTPGLAPTDSDLETDLYRLIELARLPLPVRQHPLILASGPIRFDLAYPDRLIGIEADSFSWHGDRAAFDRDRRRDNEAAALGWIVLRFTWAQVRYDPEYVVETIREHLRRRPSHELMSGR